MESFPTSPPPPAAQARAAGNAKALYRAAVVALAVIVVLTLLVVASGGLASLWARGGQPRRADRYAAGGAAASAWPRLSRRAAWDIFQLDPCCTPWARFGDAPPGSYLAGAPCRAAPREGFCSGYSDPMWGGASERENFSPDAPGACSGRSCAMQKSAAAARLEQGALAVAAGAV